MSATCQSVRWHYNLSKTDANLIFPLFFNSNGKVKFLNQQIRSSWSRDMVRKVLILGYGNVFFFFSLFWKFTNFEQLLAQIETYWPPLAIKIVPIESQGRKFSSTSTEWMRKLSGHTVSERSVLNDISSIFCLKRRNVIPQRTLTKWPLVANSKFCKNTVARWK